MQEDTNQHDRELAAMLEGLRHAYPSRQPDAAVRGRVQFLQEAESLRRSSLTRPQRALAGWFTPLWTWRKERPMLSTLVTIVLALALALGGAGATAYASQSALPGQVLYPVKLLTENARAALAQNDAWAVALQIAFTAERGEEFVTLAREGSYQVLPEAGRALADQIQIATGALQALHETNPSEAAPLSARLDEVLGRGTATLEALDLPEDAYFGIETAIAATRRGREVVGSLLAGGPPAAVPPVTPPPATVPPVEVPPVPAPPVDTPPVPAPPVDTPPVLVPSPEPPPTGQLPVVPPAIQSLPLDPLPVGEQLLGDLPPTDEPPADETPPVEIPATLEPPVGPTPPRGARP
jgi:hypothetical protein